MLQYPYAGAGLKKMFIAQVGAIVCTVIAVIPIISILGGLGSLFFAIFSLVGLYGAGRDLDGCKNAFTITIISIVLSVVSIFFSGSAVSSTIFSILDSILSFLAAYFVCSSVAEAMTQLGEHEIASKGTMVWHVNAGCYLAVTMIAMLSVIPALAAMVAIAGIVVLVISLVASVLYMVFLYQSYRALGA